MLERTSRIPRPRWRATAAHRKAVTESPPHAKKELCKLMDPWPKTCQPKTFKMGQVLNLENSLAKCSWLNLTSDWPCVCVQGIVVESCRLSDSGHQRLLLPINAEEAREHDKNRLQGGNPGGDEVRWLRCCSPDSNSLFQWVLMNISRIPGWKSSSPRLIIVMLKVRCFLRLNFYIFLNDLTGRILASWFPHFAGVLPKDPQESAPFCCYRDEAEIAVEPYLPRTAIDVKCGTSRDGVVVGPCWNMFGAMVHFIQFTCGWWANTVTAYDCKCQRKMTGIKELPPFETWTSERLLRFRFSW